MNARNAHKPIAMTGVPDKPQLDFARLRPSIRLLSDAAAVTRTAASINIVVAAILSATLWVKFNL
ncbi:MAG: hypothetical protein OEN20_12650, partial [Gammaproteobacteria bacterium]|nr:hypothetical protein [Gammaproteobacteria bacterium]